MFYSACGLVRHRHQDYLTKAIRTRHLRDVQAIPFRMRSLATLLALALFAGTVASGRVSSPHVR